jgi:hypothetical protein
MEILLMNCPRCDGEPRQIGCTARPEYVVMRWECQKCKHHYTTVEQIADCATGYTCLSCLYFSKDARYCTKHNKNTYIKSQICKNFAKKQINPMVNFAIQSAIVDALDYAKTKHPHFADTDTEAGVVIAEELLEVNDAALRVMQDINDQTSRDNLFIELAQAIATEIRMMEKLLKE